jgi:hypothetical protein
MRVLNAPLGEHVVLRSRFSVLRLKKNNSLISGLLFEGEKSFKLKSTTTPSIAITFTFL